MFCGQAGHEDGPVKARGSDSMAARIQRHANDSRARAIRLKLDAARLPNGQFLSALDLGGMGDTLAREGRDQNALDCFHRSASGAAVFRAACCCGRVV